MVREEKAANESKEAAMKVVQEQLQKRELAEQQALEALRLAQESAQREEQALKECEATARECEAWPKFFKLKRNGPVTSKLNGSKHSTMLTPCCKTRC